VDDPRTLNKILYLRPPHNIYSFNELVALWEKLIGKTVEKTYVPEEKLLKDIEGVFRINAQKNWSFAVSYSYWYSLLLQSRLFPSMWYYQSTTLCLWRVTTPTLRLSLLLGLRLLSCTPMLSTPPWKKSLVSSLENWNKKDGLSLLIWSGLCYLLLLFCFVKLWLMFYLVSSPDLKRGRRVEDCVLCQMVHQSCHQAFHSFQ